jgi:hypothetical protein
MDYLIEPNKEILLLNADYNPISIYSWRRAIKLIHKKKAKAISKRVIRLSYYVKIPYVRLMANKPNRKSIMKRDDYRCQYCGAIKNLTIDHVHPVSKGGGNTWENLTTACLDCNGKKGDKTLKEVGMILYNQPKPPYNKMTLAIQKSNVNEWKQYIYSDL